MRKLSVIVPAVNTLADLIDCARRLHDPARGVSGICWKSSPITVGNGAPKTAMDEVEEALGTRGRVLVRYSGTEPLIRVMVEGEDASLVRQQARLLARVVEQAVEARAEVG